MPERLLATLVGLLRCCPFLVPRGLCFFLAIVTLQIADPGVLGVRRIPYTRHSFGVHPELDR